MQPLKEELEDLLVRLRTLSYGLPRALLIISQIFLPSLSPLVHQDLISKMLKEVSQQFNTAELQQLISEPPHDLAFRLFLNFRHLQIFFKSFSYQLLIHLFQHLPRDPSSVLNYLLQIQSMLSHSDHSSLEFFNQNKTLPREHLRSKLHPSPPFSPEVLDLIINLFLFFSYDEIWNIKLWFQSQTRPQLTLLSSLLQIDLSTLSILRSSLLDPRPTQKRPRENSENSENSPPKLQKTENFTSQKPQKLENFTPQNPQKTQNFTSQKPQNFTSQKPQKNENFVPPNLQKTENFALSKTPENFSASFHPSSPELLDISQPPPEDFFENFFLDSLPEHRKMEEFKDENNPIFFSPETPVEEKNSGFFLPEVKMMQSVEVVQNPVVMQEGNHVPVYQLGEPFRSHMTMMGRRVPIVPVPAVSSPPVRTSSPITRSKRSNPTSLTRSRESPPSQASFSQPESQTPTEPMPESGPAFQIIVQKQPPSQTVYQRILKPCPSVLISNLTTADTNPPHNLFVEATLMRSDCSQELPNCLEGTRVVPFSALNFANFTKLKILTTSQQQGSLFRLKFQLKRYQSNVFTNLPYTVISEPIQVFSHTYYLSKKPLTA